MTPHPIIPASEMLTPRLELRWEPASGADRLMGRVAETVCRYLLVLPLRASDIRREQEDGSLVDIIEVELGRTTTTNHFRTKHTPHGIDVPFRDSAHAYFDAAQLGGLPIYASCGDSAQLVDNSRRPTLDLPLYRVVLNSCGHDAVFVEVESRDGTSVALPWHERADGFVELRFRGVA